MQGDMKKDHDQMIAIYEKTAKPTLGGTLNH
jgi:hypothetical protein